MKIWFIVIIVVGFGISGYSFNIVQEEVISRPNYSSLIARNLEQIDGYEKEKNEVKLYAEHTHNAWMKSDGKVHRLFILTAVSGLIMAGIGFIGILKSRVNATNIDR
jgi:hypothetical protein